MTYKGAYFATVALGVILLCGTVYGGYKLAKRVWLLSTSEQVIAEVVTCKEKFFQGGRRFSGMGGGGSQKYTPVAKTPEGREIHGTTFTSFDDCHDLIHKKFGVLIDPVNEDEGYILNFDQFWLGPLALFFGTLIANIIFVIPIARAIRKL